MQKIASYLVFPKIIYNLFDIVVEVSQERERKVEHTITIYKPHHFLNKEQTNKITTICTRIIKKNSYMDITIIFTFMKTCQSCIFTPSKSPLFVMIFFIFAQNPVGNLIFCITSLRTLLCCSVNIHGIEFILIWSSLL